MTNNDFADTPLKQFAAAKTFLEDCARFERNTGFEIKKANEVFSAAVVNRWLESENYDWKIAVNTKPRGADGTLIGQQTGDVEFKSSKQKSASFEFKEHFPFDEHACIVMTEFSEGSPIRIFLAFGTVAMKRLISMLAADTIRESFKRPQDNARLFSTRRPRTETSEQPSNSLVDNLMETSREDRIVQIDEAELIRLMA